MVVEETRQGLLSLPDFVSSGPHSHTSSPGAGRLHQSSKWVPPSMSSFVSIILNIEASINVLVYTPATPLEKLMHHSFFSHHYPLMQIKYRDLNTAVADVCKLSVRTFFFKHDKGCIDLCYILYLFWEGWPYLLKKKYRFQFPAQLVKDVALIWLMTLLKWVVWFQC